MSQGIRRVLPFALPLALAVLAAPPARAYSTITSPPSVWPASHIPVPVYLNQNGSADLGFATTESALQAAEASWNNVDCCSFAFNYRGSTSMTAASSSGTNVVSWSESSWSSDASAICVTEDWFGSGSIVEADMDCNGVGMTWNTTGSGRGVDTQSILTHESGHMLGLGDLYDSAHSTSIMYGVYSGGTKRTLAADDMQGCRTLYPGACGGCTTDAECGSGYHCDAGTCVVNTTTGGNMCDPCTSEADCTNGLCLSGFTDGATHCGVNCTTDADCGAGNTCWAISGASSQCAPSDGNCSGVTPPECTTSADCLSGYHCDAGNCVADVTPGCTTDSDCTADHHCESGTCVANPPSTQPFGGTCAVDTDCGSGLCLDHLCTQSCNPYTPTSGCPGGSYCDDLDCGIGRCRPGGPGAGEELAGCSSDHDCASGFCEVTGGVGTCMTPCNSTDSLAAACGYGETCQPLGRPACGACMCGAGMLGDPCSSDLDCIVGLCRSAGSGDPLRCTTECAEGACPFGATCQTVIAPTGASEQRCVASGQRVGGRCTDDSQCQSGYCLSYNGERFCTKACGGACGCPTGLQCTPVGGTDNYCMPTSIVGGNGCGCRAPGTPASGGLFALFGLALLFGLRLVRRRG